MTQDESGRYGPRFSGEINTTVSRSRPWWEPTASPPERAPNVVVVLCDDLGFSDLGCYGSEIATPNLDGLAAAGLRYVNFHSTPLCSPSRAALLTGLNHHAAGVGNLAGVDHGFPGYRGRIAEDVATAAEVFRHNGYRTLMVGKWHLSITADHSDAGRRDSWPLQRGFDRFYGFMESGLTNLHHPNMLHADNHAVDVDRYPDGYFFTDDITDHAIRMIRGVKAADPDQPFFLYLAHGAVHAPLMAKPADMVHYRGRYDRGWDALREERFARQQKLGVVPEWVQLPPRNTEAGYDTPSWTALSARQQELYARHMEVYAGMVDNVDQNLGRLRDVLAQLGELDNTVIVFTSDNGGSREGGRGGTTEYFRTVAAVHMGLDDGDSLERDYERLELLGGPRVMGHYPWGWGMVSNTPFRLHKGTTFAGGHHVPFILSWPARVAGAGEVRNQYIHITDVLPTLADMIGLALPDRRDGRPLRPMTGVSFARSIDDGTVATEHHEQYYEMSGHRGFYRYGWETVTLHRRSVSFDDEHWHLFHLDRDPTERTDMADDQPGRTKQLAAAWEEAARQNQVYPLDDGGLFLLSPTDRRIRRGTVTLYPGTPTLERSQAARLISGRSFQITATVDYCDGDQGVLVAHGDQGGGYALYIDEDGRLVYAHNGYGQMTVVPTGPLHRGARQLAVRVATPGDATWTVELAVDGETMGSQAGLAAFPGGLAPFEGIDIGIDRRSPVCWDLYERFGPYSYTGTLKAVTYEPAPSEPDSRDLRVADHRAALRSQ